MNALVAFRANALGHLSTPLAQVAEFASQQASRAASASLKASGEVSSDKAKAVIQSAANELGRDAFLQLLVMELRYQDPTEPINSSQMITQLAQFSTLEAATILNENFAELTENFAILAGNIDQLNFISAQGLLGDNIQGINFSGEIVEGVVDAVHLEGNIVVLSVEGQLVPMSGVLSIASRPADGDPSASASTKSEV